MKNKQLKLGLKPKPLNVTFRITEEVRTIVTKFVNVEGEEFELEDLMDTLSEIETDYDTIVTNKRMADHFIKIEVLKYAGSRRNMMGAEKGSCFKDLYEQVKEEYFKEE